MTDREITKLRNMLENQYGVEKTKEEIKRDCDSNLALFASIKEKFIILKSDVDGVQKKLDSGIFDIEEATRELSKRFKRKISENDCRYLLQMNSVFDYSESDSI